MTLSEYLESKSIKVVEFAYAIGVKRNAVYSYLSGNKKPSESTLLEIYQATNGLVTANDFYLPKKSKRKK